jgi:hypothetical protein
MVTMAELLAEAEKKAPKPRKRPSPDEHNLQCACVRWFRYQYPHLHNALFAVPNGGRTWHSVAVKLKAEGVVAGVADLILLVQRGGYGGMLIEMKTPKGYQRPEQKAWQKSMEAQGYLYVVVRTLDDFIETITNYLNNNGTPSKE